MKAAAGGGGGGGTSGGRSESEKEKTKLRERQRRAITTKIFNGLRKWGGYHLSPRADINEVLRELAKEAGWVVEPDGTTYRAPRLPPIGQCHVCGAATPTASSSVVVGGGGDSSTTASPRHVSLGGEPNPNNTAKKVAGGSSSSQYLTAADIPLAFYLYGSSGCGPPRGPHFTTSSTTTATVTSPPLYGGVPPAVTLATQHQHQFYNLQEVKASNHNTPMSSPLRRLT